MALDEFTIVSLNKIDGTYLARIRFNESEEDYVIRSNCVLSHLPWLKGDSFSIYTKDYVQIPRNGELEIHVIGRTRQARENALGLERALRRFSREQSNSLKICKSKE